MIAFCVENIIRLVECDLNNFSYYAVINKAIVESTMKIRDNVGLCKMLVESNRTYVKLTNFL